MKQTSSSYIGLRSERLATPPFSLVSPAYGLVWQDTDTKLTFVSGDGYGRGNLNHSTFTLIGPTFGSGHFYAGLAGQFIQIDGVTYTIASANSNTVYLTTDSGFIKSNVTWGIVNSYWFYAGGFETLSLATLQGRTFEPTDDQYNAFIYDYGHSVSYNGTSGLWGWGLSDSGSNYQVLGNLGPPKGGIWATCNGTNTTVLDIVLGAPMAVTIATPSNTGYYLRR